MADKKISQLSNAAVPLTGTEVLPIVQSASTVKVSVSNFNAGSAAKWTTARNLAGNSVDGSADVAFSNKFVVQGTADAGLSGAQFLGSLTTGIVKNTTSTGVLSIASAGTDYVAPASGQVLQTKVASYAPNDLKDLYTGTNTDELYYNSEFNQTITGLTAGSTLIVSVCGGRLLFSNAGDAFAWYLQIDGTDVSCGATYVPDAPLMIQGFKTSISGSSVTVKLGGFSRYDNRSPRLDLRTNVSGDGGGNGVLGGALNWVFTEIKA
jgi:hypothetical protein